MSDGTMAKKDHASRMAALTAKIESPSVVGEIDKVLRDMRHEWLDMIGLRQSAVRRHGERGGAPLPPVLPFEPEPAPNASAVEQVSKSEEHAPTMTLAMLMDQYTSDQDSLYQKLNFSSRKHYDTMMSLIRRDYGDTPLSEISGRLLQQWHSTWSDGGAKNAVAHGKVGMLRRLFAFGILTLESDECVRLATVLRSLRIKSPRRRTERLTTDQANAIRAKAHERERPSLALAQAFQHDFGLLQKETIGEWVPMSEDGEPDIVKEFSNRSEKWLRGLRWEYIDDRLILRVPDQTFPDGRVLNLRLAPMILDELHRQFQFGPDAGRAALPSRGPIIVSEHDGLPWPAVEFRRWWRMLANECNVPKNVRNSDSRAKIGRRYPDDDAGHDEIEDDGDEEFEGGEEMSLH